ncbi:MAG: hypothetical protein WD005_00985, partial [Haliea sp.]
MALTLRTKEILTGLIIIVVAFGWIFAGEALLRIQQAWQFGGDADVESSDAYHIQPATGLRIPVPNATLGALRFNSLGFRGPEIELPKPPDRLRVAFVGSSTVLDPYVGEDSETWVAQAMATLATEFPKCQFDYVNAGVPGFSLESMALHYKANVAKVQPDLVVAWTGGMNSILDKHAIEANLHRGPHYVPSLLARVSLFWSKVEMNAIVLQRQRAAYRESGMLNQKVYPITDEYRQNLKKMYDAAAESGAMIAMLPVPGWLREGVARELYEEAAKTDVFFMPYMTYEGLVSARSRFDEALTEFAS